MTETDLALLISSIASLVEQLGKALIELESEKDFTLDNVQLQEAEEHFRHLETLMLNKFLEIEIRENSFQEEECETQRVIASKDADVTAKEQDMMDRIQELKDSAFAAIFEARSNHPMLSFASVSAADSKHNQVSFSLGDRNALLSHPEVKTPHKNGEKAEGLPGEAEPRPELLQLCEQMDAKGLLTFFMDNQKNIPSICEELVLALESATEPAHLVMTSLQGFYPPEESNQKDNKNDAALHGMRNSCLMIMKAMANLLAKANSSANHFLSPVIKQQAKTIADEWRFKLAGTGIDAANGSNSLEAEAFLQLLATFRIASEFDEEELCKLVLSVPRLWQGPELCHSLELAHKMPGVVEELIKSGRQIEAARFIHYFKLTERFPLVPLLKAYLKDRRRNSQGKTDANAQELAALGAVIQCIEDYKLEAEYPLHPLQSRIVQLENSKRNSESKKYQPSNKSRANAGSHGFRVPVAGFTRQTASPFSGRASHSGMSVRYPHAGPFPSQASSQPSYLQQGYDERSYYYPQDDRSIAAAHGTASTNYGGYMSTEMQFSNKPYT